MTDITREKAIKWLHAAREYFLKKPNDEDMAFWANLNNAETCKRIAELIAEADADTNRLDYLNKMDGWGLVSDDAGHWALVTDGLQTVPDEAPADVSTMFIIEKDKWHNSVREAIRCRPG